MLVVEMGTHADTSDQRPTASDEFVWPPQPVAEDSTPGSSADPLGAPTPGTPERSVRHWIVAAERGLLRPVEEPIDRQIAELGWSRDALDDYCQRCGRTIGPHEDDEFGCGRCGGTELAFDRAVRLGEYGTPLDRWVWCLKFQRLRTFGRRLGEELGEALIEAGALTSPPPGGVVLQPVPASLRRRWTRGIDHAAVLAGACAEVLEVPVVGWVRRAHRPSQRSVTASDRWTNAQGSVRVTERGRSQLMGCRAIVLDDVMTSGATARAMALALKGRPDARYRPASWGAAEVWSAFVASTE